MSTTLRRMAHEVHWPIGGRKFEVFTLVPSGVSLGEKQWDYEDELPGNGRVKGEIIGVAEVESDRRLQNQDTLEDLVRQVETIGDVIFWEGDWERPDLSDVDDDELEEPEEVVPDGSGAAASVDDLEPDPEPETGDGIFRRPNGDVVAEPTGDTFQGDTVYSLRNRARDDDVRPDVIYQARVDGKQDYGVFVHLNSPLGMKEVSGLVHKSNLPFARRPQDYRVGEQVFVELIRVSDKGLELNMLEGEVDQ